MKRSIVRWFTGTVSGLALLCAGMTTVGYAQLQMHPSVSYSNRTDIAIDGSIELGHSINLLMLNCSGNNLSLGDVLVVGSTQDWCVTTTSTEADPRVIGAVIEGGAHGQTVLVAIGGLFQVRIEGGASVGALLKTSTTAGKAKAAAAGKGAFAAVVSSGTVPDLVFALPLMAEGF